MSKGSKRRPMAISQAEWGRRFDEAFGKRLTRVTSLTRRTLWDDALLTHFPFDGFDNPEDDDWEDHDDHIPAIPV